MSDATRKPVENLPIVDLRWLDHHSRPEYADTVANVSQACQQHGFFYARNHGIPEKVVTSAFAAARDFFALPSFLKREVALKGPPGINSGWFDSGFQVLDEENDASGDLKEGYRLFLNVEGNDHPPAGGAGIDSNQWPSKPAEFRESMVEFCDSARNLNRRLLRTMAKALGLNQSGFDSHFSQGNCVLLPLHYPPQSVHGDSIGAGAHTDFGALTILAQDSQDGLEALDDEGNWVDVPPIPGTLIVILGDLIARWTNDSFKPVMHRVVNKSGVERYSIPCFCEPDPQAIVECLPTCISSEQPAKYEPIAASVYMGKRIQKAYYGGEASHTLLK